MLRAQLTNTRSGPRDLSEHRAGLRTRPPLQGSRRSGAQPPKIYPASRATTRPCTSLLGAIYERQKFFDRAEEQFKKVLDVDPNNAIALNYYGYMLGDLGQRLDEAEAMVKPRAKGRTLQRRVSR